MKAELYFYEKQYIGASLVLEMVIWQISKKEFLKFPEGYKYRMILIILKSGKKVLMDNHHPKSHHVHLNESEFEYSFLSLEQLIKDFKSYCLKFMGVSL